MFYSVECNPSHRHREKSDMVTRLFEPGNLLTAVTYHDGPDPRFFYDVSMLPHIGFGRDHLDDIDVVMGFIVVCGSK
jgi:hypothetical protein